MLEVKYNPDKFFELLCQAPELEENLELDDTLAHIELITNYEITLDMLDKMSWDDLDNAYDLVLSNEGNSIAPHPVFDMVMVQKVQDNLEGVTPIKQIYKRHFL